VAADFSEEMETLRAFRRFSDFSPDLAREFGRIAEFYGLLAEEQGISIDCAGNAIVMEDRLMLERALALPSCAPSWNRTAARCGWRAVKSGERFSHCCSPRRRRPLPRDARQVSTGSPRSRHSGRPSSRRRAMPAAVAGHEQVLAVGAIAQAVHMGAGHLGQRRQQAAQGKAVFRVDSPMIQRALVAPDVGRASARRSFDRAQLSTDLRPYPHPTGQLARARNSPSTWRW
jgi:hypothetical protein